jgi:hypothetical protein
MHVDLRHALWLIANSKAHAITSDVGTVEVSGGE